MQQASVDVHSGTHMNPLLQMEALGQSVWLDFTHRAMILDGELQALIKDDGLSGITSNPSIFEKAIDDTHEYDAAIDALVSQGNDAKSIYEALAVEDLQHAADLFRPTYDRTGGRDGFVSMEVSPHLAHDTAGSVAEARRLWAALDRPNVMVKVPATREGLPAIRQLIGEGININITLLFGLQRYRDVVDAYMGGLEERLQRGQPVGHLASVASFFLSRIDVKIDPRLEQIIKSQGQVSAGAIQAGAESHPVSALEIARHLLGQTAIASAKVAYQIYSQDFGGRRFRALLEHGARTQKLLWASTSTKNPAYPDVKYVEALIGPDTIDTLPLETLNAFRDHGMARPTLEADSLAAHQALADLGKVGINLDEVTQELEVEGVQKFNEAFDKMLAALEKKRPASRSAQRAA
jgi:transaldolase